jgi:5'-nucleotidase
MKILISNDDGYQAIGIQTLINELKNIAQLIIVAPDRNRSGSSSSLTLDKAV